LSLRVICSSRLYVRLSLFPCLSASCFFFFPIPPPPISTLFPYTTLFRSRCHFTFNHAAFDFQVLVLFSEVVQNLRRSDNVEIKRSEEHTSELQSRFDLVCRLLLEKKKKKKQQEPTPDEYYAISRDCIIAS